MQGLVTLDFGNSNPHAGLFHKNQGKWDLIKVVPFNELTIYLAQLGMNPGNTSLVLCEVKAREDELQTLIDEGYYLTRLRDYWRGTRFAGMPVNYAPTLGQDRLIEAYYCFKKAKVSTLIINAGTFVTMDVLNAEGFQGGYIIPSPQNYFECYQKGEQLKTLSLESSASSTLPQTSEAAMAHSYYAFAALAQKLTQEHKIEKIVLSGGNVALWEGFFESSSQESVVEKEPHLVHWALHFWYTTQIETL